MHVVPEQPQQRLYPINREELISSARHAINPPLGGIAQVRATGSHWGISKTSVTPGYVIETATPVHEADGDQNAGRLNEALYTLRAAGRPCIASASFGVTRGAMPGIRYRFHFRAG
jgi:hypothetical protein